MTLIPTDNWINQIRIIYFMYQDHNVYAKCKFIDYIDDKHVWEIQIYFNDQPSSWFIHPRLMKYLHRKKPGCLHYIPHNYHLSYVHRSNVVRRNFRLCMQKYLEDYILLHELIPDRQSNLPI